MFTQTYTQYHKKKSEFYLKLKILGFFSLLAVIGVGLLFLLMII
tara:strand:- start:112 stop:243 length:132 start_codon:yes stop_codon:yes gene_type:complete